MNTLDDVLPPELASRTVAELGAERQQLQRLVGLDERRTKQLRELARQAARARAEISKLDDGIADAEAPTGRYRHPWDSARRMGPRLS